MCDNNANYPPMSQSEWDNAPWNTPKNPEMYFEVDVEYVLQKKKVMVATDDFDCIVDGANEYDINTDATDWEEAYNNSHYTISELLATLKSYLKQDLERYKDIKRAERKLQGMIQDCEGWEMLDKSYTQAK